MKYTQLLYRTGKYGALLFALVFLITAGAIAIDGMHNRIGKSDVAIVLGSKVNPDGTLSPRLAARLDEAIILYKDGMFRNIIVSGGTGKEGVDEAVAMQTYLEARQIPAASIITDHHGDTTEATARNSRRIMQEHGFTSALLVSQYFHLPRARMALQSCHITQIYNAHSQLFEWRDTYSLSREVFAFYDYYFHSGTC